MYVLSTPITMAIDLSNKKLSLDTFRGHFDSAGFRPAVSLKSGTTIISGDGTQNNPYIIG